jgi:hypothetical protein
MAAMRTRRWLLATLLFVPCSVNLRAFAGEVGASIAGVVRDPAGAPIPSVWITREGHRGKAGLVNWYRTDVDGRFKIDGVPAGDVVLRVTPGAATILEGQLVTARAPTKDLVVVVEPGPQLAVRIADYVAPSGDPRHARLTWTDAGGTRSVRYAPIRKDGWTRFVRLPADRDLELWTIAADGRPVRSGALRTGDAEVRLTPLVGKEIRGKLLVSPRDSTKSPSVRVEAYPGFEAGSAKVQDDKTFVVTNLPQGTYRIAAWFGYGEVSLPVEREVAAGTADVVLDIRR